MDGSQDFWRSEFTRVWKNYRWPYLDNADLDCQHCCVGGAQGEVACNEGGWNVSVVASPLVFAPLRPFPLPLLNIACVVHSLSLSARPPFFTHTRRLRHRRLDGTRAHVRAGRWRRRQVLGRERLRAAGHREHFTADKTYGCGYWIRYRPSWISSRWG